jgi:hypothetical protein
MRLTGIATISSETAEATSDSLLDLTNRSLTVAAL